MKINKKKKTIKLKEIIKLIIQIYKISSKILIYKIFYSMEENYQQKNITMYSNEVIECKIII